MKIAATMLWHACLLVAGVSTTSASRLARRPPANAPSGDAGLKKAIADATVLPNIKLGKFMYLVQGDYVPSWAKALGRRSDTQVMFLSYKEDAGTVEGILRTIFFPKSTWTTGRNRLYSEALQLQDEQRWRFEYLVFADDDAQLYAREEGVDPYSVFHAALRNVQPAVGAVAFEDYRNSCGVTAPCAPNVDAIVNAFHATAAPMLLPYHADFDATSWFISQQILIVQMALSMPEYVVQFNQLFTKNARHSHYPRGYGKKGAVFQMAEGLVRELGSDCLAARAGSWRAHGACHACAISRNCNQSAECTPADKRAGSVVSYASLIKCQPYMTSSQQRLFASRQQTNRTQKQQLGRAPVSRRQENYMQQMQPGRTSASRQHNHITTRQQPQPAAESQQQKQLNQR